MSSPFGDNSLDLPFEALHTPAEIDLVDPKMAGGVVIMAGLLPVPGCTAGVTNKPCLIYRFTSPEGSFYPPIVLCADEGQLVKTGDLTAAAAEAAPHRSKAYAMTDDTKIEWADATWNPLVGCTKVSPGCDHCYAETLVNRFAGKNKGFPNRFDVVTIRDDKMLTQPLRWREPKRIFVNSLSDLFHKDVPEDFIDHVFGVMAANLSHTRPTHNFQLLTKRHARMRSYLSNPDARHRIALAAAGFTDDQHADATHDFILYGNTWPLPNVWLGVSVENQQWADLRIPALLDTPAAVRFLSCEPLLGPVDLVNVDSRAGGRGWDVLDAESDYHPAIDWVIVGGESGPGARPMHPEWARSLRDQCVATGVPFLFKQWGEWRWAAEVDDIEAERALRASGQPDPFARTSCYTVGLDGSYTNSEPPRDGNATMMRVGKKAAGRELDGRTWDEYPPAVVR